MKNGLKRFNMKKVYYAHFMGIYGTPQEKRDIQTLVDLGFEVINPNNWVMSDRFTKEIKIHGYEVAFDSVFLSEVRDCEVFAFKALPDGRIPGGVAWELREAQKRDKLIIELPSGMHARSMGKDDTREYLKDIGQR
tara:strand:+ start:55379 stop:55786 length:408 start_codon:yes stop_codon:yes gene_type:complete